MTWYFIEMPDTSLMDGAYHRLCREFQKAFIDAGAPDDLALFARREVAPVRRLYLSPCSDSYVPDLIREYQGQPCTMPDASGVTLIYGVPGAMALLHEPPPAFRKAEPSLYSLRRSNEPASTG